MDENGNLTGKNLSDIKRLMSFDNPLMYAIGNTAAGHAMLIRKSTLQNCYPFPTMIPHDYWLGFVATFNSKLNFIDIPLVYYRQHQTNVFGVKSKGVKRKKRNNIKFKFSNTICNQIPIFNSFVYFKYVQCKEKI